MDRHTHLLASVLQTCTMLHPDDPKAAVEHANRILDQVELYDQERYTRPLAAEIDEELQDLQDDLLPDPGDMVPHQEHEKSRNRNMEDFMKAINDRLLIKEMERRAVALSEKLDNLYDTLVLNIHADPFEEIVKLKYEARSLKKVFEYRNNNQKNWPLKFYDSDDLIAYVSDK